MSRRSMIVLALVLAACAGLGCAVSAGPGAGGGQDKVLVCHKGKTLEVAAPALDAHLRHGDARGPCR